MMRGFEFLAPLMAGSMLWPTATCTGQHFCPGAELFTNGIIHRLRIDMSPEAAASLRTNPRKFVAATVSEDNAVYSPVGVRLKGSTGSFRPLDDKPALTLDFCEFRDGQKFHDLRRIYLNNSVEDPSYVNEKLGSELFQAAGIPAPRITRALVQLNGRALGLYVLKEGFTEDFLSCHFKHVGGDLFEADDDAHDVDAHLKRNAVRAPVKNRAALKSLAEAATETDPAERWRKLERTLDVERFLNFMALEVMLGHRDGYCLARNNFRVYHDVDLDKMIFLPHGMDQLLGTADLPWQPSFAGLVAGAVITTPEGMRRYRSCFGNLLTNLFNAETLTSRVDELVQELRPVLGRSERTGVREAAAQVKERIVKRRQSLISQLSRPPLKLLKFVSGVGRLEGWQASEKPARGEMNQVARGEGAVALHTRVEADTAATWRTTALLPRGRYRFEGRVRIADVQPLPFGKHQGAALRITGRARQGESFTGDSSWRKLVMDFQVEQPSEEVEFICELRARAGEAWFDLDSLNVVQMGD